MAMRAQRLQRTEPEQSILTLVWNNMVRHRCKLPRVFRAQAAQRLRIQLTFAAGFPRLSPIPLGPGPLCFRRLRPLVSIPLLRNRMGVTVCRPKINQPETARMPAGFLWHGKSFNGVKTQNAQPDFGGRFYG